MTVLVTTSVSFAINPLTVLQYPWLLHLTVMLAVRASLVLVNVLSAAIAMFVNRVMEVRMWP